LNQRDRSEVHGVHQASVLVLVELLDGSYGCETGVVDEKGLLSLVAAGVGITRLAASARSLRSGGVTFVELEDERAATVLFTRPGHANPAVEHLRSVAAEAMTAPALMP
jgi:hypothetical protein